MSGKKHGQPLSVRLRQAAEGVDHLGEIRAEASGWLKRDPPGAPYSLLMREAADLAERYEQADSATFRRRRGLVDVVPSVTWFDGQVFRIVPEEEGSTNG